jgi:hypothetical protein
MERPRVEKWLAIHITAPGDDQVMVLLCPAVMVVGDAVKVVPPVLPPPPPPPPPLPTVTVALWVTLPPEVPVQVRV